MLQDMQQVCAPLLQRGMCQSSKYMQSDHPLTHQQALVTLIVHLLGLLLRTSTANVLVSSLAIHAMKTDKTCT